MQNIQRHIDGYDYSSDKSLLQLHVIHKFLSEDSYWCKQIPLKTLELAVENSFCIGMYKDGNQVGFSRIITDYSTFAYLADVFVLEGHRGKSISKNMMSLIMELDWIGQVRRFSLATVDAHGLYTQFGFRTPEHPDRLMEIVRPRMYELAAEKLAGDPA
jgi:GNAT superfamily N-acetyltransferase